MTRGALQSARRREAERWSAKPPPAWEPVAEVCRDMFRRLPEITARLNGAITKELPDFRVGASVVSRDDLDWATSRHVARYLHALAERRAPDERDLVVPRLVGRRSAIRGLPLQPLIASFHIGHRELWSALVETAERLGGDAPSLLLVGGTTVWQRMLATTTVATEGYQGEIAQREAQDAQATARFVEALEKEPCSEHALRAMRDLGFDPETSFRVVAVSHVAGSTGVSVLVPALLARGGTATHADRGNACVIVTQRVEGRALEEALASLPAGTPAGVGMEAEGPAGVYSSLLQAERALELAVLRRRTCRFDEDWFGVTVLSQGELARKVLARGIEVATSHPHLAAAVRTFAHADFSVAESARRLLVSHNSLRYRLNRWRALTGWDPWSYDGLSRSMTALELVDEVGGLAP